MSWSPDLYIGEMRPWPESVTVRRGNESRVYVPLDNPLATYDEDREILSVVSKYIPNEVHVTKTDQRDATSTRQGWLPSVVEVER